MFLLLLKPHRTVVFMHIYMFVCAQLYRITSNKTSMLLSLEYRVTCYFLWDIALDILVKLDM